MSSLEDAIGEKEKAELGCLKVAEDFEPEFVCCECGESTGFGQKLNVIEGKVYCEFCGKKYLKAELKKQGIKL
jgi:ArsR family metal-binding transcriptional regulator